MVQADERGEIEQVIRALGTRLGLEGDAVDEAIGGVGPQRGMLADASQPMAFAVEALRRVGEAVRDADGDFEGDVFLVNLLSGERHQGRGTQLDECEDPDSVREVLARGYPVAISQLATLLVWNRGDRVELWETAPHNRPIVHAGVLAWLTRAAGSVHLVE